MTASYAAMDRDQLAERSAGLLARVAGGDREAFHELYRATSSLLLGICLQVLRDRGEAEDVLQDVYVAIWDKAAQFDQTRAKATTWLGAIARHRAIDRLRGRPAQSVAAPIELIEQAPGDDPTPQEQAERADDRERLDDCLARLEPRRRRLIRTAFFEGATYDELATRSGSPLGSVKSWIRRGLLQLRECLEA